MAAASDFGSASARATRLSAELKGYGRDLQRRLT
jgi:hypothetical protein